MYGDLEAEIALFGELLIGLDATDQRMLNIGKLRTPVSGLLYQNNMGGSDSPSIS